MEGMRVMLSAAADSLGDFTYSPILSDGSSELRCIFAQRTALLPCLCSMVYSNYDTASDGVTGVECRTEENSSSLGINAMNHGKKGSEYDRENNW